MTLSRELVIAGVGQTNYLLAGHRDIRLEDLIFQACAAALEDSGLTRQDMDNVVIAASDLLDGRCISSMLTANPAGAYLKDEIKAADEGSFALVVAALRLLSGEFETALVATWSKPSEGQYARGQLFAADPFYHRPFGLNHITASAVMASAYRARFQIDQDALAMVVQKNRLNGQRNQRVAASVATDMEEIAESRVVAYPLREAEIAPEADGACALVLTTRERLPRSDRRTVKLAGFGWATDSYYLGERDLSRFRSLEIASHRAYQMAAIDDPLEEIDVAEISDHTAYHELMTYEALGFCAAGEGSRLLRDGTSMGEGSLPVNPSGGCLCAHPVFSAGLTRVIETYLQVSGRASDHQAPGVRTGLAQGCAGYAGQSHAVFILSRD